MIPGALVPLVVCCDVPQNLLLEMFFAQACPQRSLRQRGDVNAQPFGLSEIVTRERDAGLHHQNRHTVTIPLKGVLSTAYDAIHNDAAIPAQDQLNEEQFASHSDSADSRNKLGHEDVGVAELC